MAIVLLLAASACRQPESSPTPPPRASEPSPEPSARPKSSAEPEATPDGVAGDPWQLARGYRLPGATELAEAIGAAERAIRDPDTSQDAARDAGIRQQAAYRQIVAEPGLREPVVAALPQDLQHVARLNLDAGSDLAAMTRPKESLPDWRIVPPPPADELLGHYREAASAAGIDWTYLAAIHLVETRMGRIIGLSSAGARGPMQFLPSTWEQWGQGSIDDAKDSIRAAARYLAGHGAPGNMDRALFAYNRSNRYVAAVKRYAALMSDDASAYRGYHAWQVYYRTTRGDALLYEGWSAAAEPPRS